MSYYRSQTRESKAPYTASQLARNARVPRFHLGQAVTVVREGHPVCIRTIKAARENDNEDIYEDTWEYQLTDDKGEDYDHGVWVEQDDLLESRSGDSHR